MKKIFFVTALALASLAGFSQVKVYRLSDTTSNLAYAAPDYILVDFQKNYPAAVTTVVWETFNPLWRATYKENNRISQVYYNTNGVNYRVSLPVMNTFVPEEVISAAIDTYGTALYSINRMKPIGDVEIYQVRLTDIGTTPPVMTDTWMNSKGDVLTQAEIFKMKTENDKLKIKSDEMKIKIKPDADPVKEQ